MAIKNDSKPYILEKPAEIAQEYGGNKQKIAAAAQRGIIDPTAAVLAGMFIDQMRTAAAQEQVSNQTVAQQVFAPPAPQMPPAGLGATAPAQQMAMAAPPMQPPATPLAQPPAPMPAPGMADGGLASLPVPDSLYDDSYAGGGVVAFSNGDLVGGLGSTFYGNAQEQYEFPDTRTDEEKARDYAYELYRRNQEKMRNVFAGNVPLDKGLAEKRIGPEAANLLRIQDMGRGALPAGPAAAPVARPAGVAAAPAATAPVISAAAKELTPEQFKQQQREFGIEEDPLKAAREKIASMAGESKLDRAFAKNLALVQAGLGIMGGTSPYALQNIGKGAAEAVATYSKDVKEIKAAERDLFKMQTELAKADDARKRGDFKGFQDHNEKARDYSLKLEKLALDKEVAAAQKGYYSRPSQFSEQYALYAADEKAAGRQPTFEGFRKALGSSDEAAMLNRQRYADTALSQDTEYLKYSMSKKPEDQQRAREIRARIYRQYGLTSSSGPAGATAGRATFLGFE